MKRYLYEVDLLFLKITTTIQVLVFVATIVIESNPTDYNKNVNEIFLFVDFTSCFTSYYGFSTYGLMKDGNDERLCRIRKLFSLIVGYLLIMSRMRELGNATNEAKIMDTCVQMLRVNAVTETVSMIFYSLLLNGFNEYYVRVDQTVIVRIDQTE
ncbi:hypothetical protein L2E82_19565 [Cichorium intybus]|uniref:Uncharacterized protein n=1 Tax=Cichorium intybus TaxID=13427 RepID=A0ACB9FC67_CICIN|nr:hypothetical protein L2E82_19565 [Cichorium intybus]